MPLVTEKGPEKLLKRDREFEQEKKTLNLCPKFLEFKNCKHNIQTINFGSPAFKLHLFSKYFLTKNHPYSF